MIKWLFVRIVLPMNEIGMIIDVSHVAESTFWDIIETTKDRYRFVFKEKGVIP